MSIAIQFLPALLVLAILVLVGLKFRDAWKSPQRQSTESLDSYHLRAISTSLISIKRILLFWIMLTLVGAILIIIIKQAS
jgi:hypothetical protein